MVRSEQTEQNAEGRQEEKPPFEEPSYCLFYGVVGPELLYGH
jgi:hypothetical protein